VSELRFADAFGDHMVPQSEKNVSVWGFGAVGKTVRLSLGDVSATARVGKDGRWYAELSPMPASAEPRALVAAYAARGDQSTEEPVKLSDVLVGEVLFCTGQSNMELGIGAEENGAEEVQKATNGNIRYLLVFKASSPVPTEKLDAQWAVVSPERICQGGWGGLSGVAYHCAEVLQRKLGVPVGIIQAAFGGAKIVPFVSPRRLKAEKPLGAHYAEWLAADRAWHETRAKNPGAKAAEAHRFAPYVNYDQLKPCTVWNAMVQPFIPFTVRAVLWYQGESNVGDGPEYLSALKALYATMRDAFGDRDLPVLTALIAPYKYGNDEDLLRMWQYQIESGKFKNSELVSTVDLGDLADIHPLKKRPVGERFAALLLEKIYRKPGGLYRGPWPQSWRRERGTVVLEYENLMKVTAGTRPEGFEAEDQDGVFKPVSARIDGERVLVDVSALVKARRLRYWWRVDEKSTLTDASGIPSIPFFVTF
jgi:sialate O-acetylesterase